MACEVASLRDFSSITLMATSVAEWWEIDLFCRWGRGIRLRSSPCRCGRWAGRSSSGLSCEEIRLFWVNGELLRRPVSGNEEWHWGLLFLYEHRYNSNIQTSSFSPLKASPRIAKQTLKYRYFCVICGNIRIMNGWGVFCELIIILCRSRGHPRQISKNSCWVSPHWFSAGRQALHWKLVRGDSAYRGHQCGDCSFQLHPLQVDVAIGQYFFRHLVVPRILYEKTLSPPMRHLRHFFPAVVGIGSVWLYWVSCTFGTTTRACGRAGSDAIINTILMHDMK